jgi:hypothetical protein
MRSGNLSRWMLAGAASGVLCCADAARADLSWEHTGTLRVSKQKQPMLRFKMYNNWTPQRHRLLFNYSVHNLAGLSTLSDQIPMSSTYSTSPFSASPLGALSATPLSGAPLAFGKAPGVLTAITSALRPQIKGGVKNFGGLGFVQRIDDDRLVAYESQSRRFVSEPRRALFQRLRFDPWKALKPELSREAPPTFTPQQRERLMQEVYSVFEPLQRRMQRVYFRPLTEQRTFQGLPGRGYRLTQATNVGGMGKGQQQWVRMAFEWWVADMSEADDAVQQFSAAARENLRGIAWPTTSMWINEAISLSRYPGDPQMRRAMQTFQRVAATSVNSTTDTGAMSTAPELTVTPLYMAATISLPPAQRAQYGDVRLEIYLTQRSTEALPETVFAQPGAYSELKLEPFLKQVDPILDGTAIKSLWDSVLN